MTTSLVSCPEWPEQIKHDLGNISSEEKLAASRGSDVMLQVSVGGKSGMNLEGNCE